MSSVVERKAAEAVAKADKRAKRDGKPVTVVVAIATSEQGRAMCQAEAWAREDGSHVVVFRFFGDTFKLSTMRAVKAWLDGLLAEDVGAEPELPGAVGPAVDEVAPPL